MVALPDARMTATAFLEWAHAQDGRFELSGGKVVSMSPETVRHVQVKTEVWLALRTAIAGAKLPCMAFGDGVSLIVDETTVREPDASVQCKPADLDSLSIDEPVIVVEVVSPSSVRGDTGAKTGDYFRVASVRHYLIVDPYSRIVIRHSRANPSGKIETSIVRDGDIHLDPPGLSVPFAALFGALEP